MKAMKFQEEIPSIPINIFKGHYVLVFDLTSIQDATENCNYPQLLGESLSLGLNFFFPSEHVAEIFVLGERMPSVSLDWCSWKKYLNCIMFLSRKQSTVFDY